MELEDSLDGLVEADETYAGDVVSATEYTFRCSDRRKGEIFNAALDKKTGFDWRKIWQADCTHPRRKHPQAHPRGPSPGNLEKKIWFLKRAD